SPVYNRTATRAAKARRIIHTNLRLLEPLGHGPSIWLGGPEQVPTLDLGIEQGAFMSAPQRCAGTKSQQTYGPGTMRCPCGESGTDCGPRSKREARRLQVLPWTETLATRRFRGDGRLLVKVSAKLLWFDSHDLSVVTSSQPCR